MMEVLHGVFTPKGGKPIPFEAVYSHDDQKGVHQYQTRVNGVPHMFDLTTGTMQVDVFPGNSAIPFRLGGFPGPSALEGDPVEQSKVIASAGPTRHDFDKPALPGIGWVLTGALVVAVVAFGVAGLHVVLSTW